MASDCIVSAVVYNSFLMNGMTRREVAAMIDHTMLRPDAGPSDIERVCAEARTHGFPAVFVAGTWVQTARHFLEETSVKVGCAVGFPLGNSATDLKRYETEVAVDDGAEEIDVVLNVGRLRVGDHRYVLRELRDVVEAADERVVKVILETGLLTREEKLAGCSLAIEAGAKFVKTCTGFGPSGATVDDVRLLREAVGPGFGVKASGGIRDTAAAIALIEAGANRLGLSASLAVLAGLPGDN